MASRLKACEGQVRGEGAEGLRRWQAAPAAGFTLIEMLVVVGVLLVLIGFAVVGFKQVGDRTKVNSTRVTLENLKTAYLEAESRGIATRQPPALWIYDNGGTRSKSIDVSLPAPTTNRKPDLWRLPNPNADPSVTPSPGLPPAVLSVFSPGSVDDTLKTEPRSWLTDPVVRNTGIALAMLRGVPTVAKSLDALGNGVNKTADFWSTDGKYQKDSRVLADDTVSVDKGLKVFVATKEITTAGSAPTPPDWKEDFGAVLDPFGNPIVFVPAAGLQVGRWVTAAGTGNFKPGDRVYVSDSGSQYAPNRAYWICLQATTTGPSYGSTPSTTWKRADPIRSPDGKPFWASAGPDGNFDTNEDNVYSFEN